MALLNALSSAHAPSLVALSLVDTRGEPLSPNLLADLPCQLPTLQYISWEGHGGKVLYKLERKDGKVLGVHCEPLRKPRAGPRVVWVDESVLDHFGAASDDW